MPELKYILEMDEEEMQALKKVLGEFGATEINKQFNLSDEESHKLAMIFLELPEIE